MITTLALVSTSRAQDAGYLAMKDVTGVAAAVRAPYRIVGGQMVTLLVAAYEVTGVPARETADADLGTTFDVVADPNLVAVLTERGYGSVGAANRFERVDAMLTLAIDVLVPSFTGRLETSQQHGDMVVDEIPGLSFALERPALELSLETRLTDARTVQMNVALPDPVAALCLKALSYGSRYAARDAHDLWRLLEVAYTSGIRVSGWPTSATPSDASVVLHRFFNRAPANGLRDISADTAIQTRVRALVAAVVAELGQKGS